MKAIALIIIVASLLISSMELQANTLNEVVKEARRQGQVLSAKTYRGVHEVRVVTPQGSVKTIRKPAEENKSSQSSHNRLMPFNYNQPSRSTQKQQSRHEFERKREPRKPVTIRPSTREPQRSHAPQGRQPKPRQRSNDRDPD